MITMGFNTLAMLTYGLGIRMPWPHLMVLRPRPKIEFRNKPPGIAVEEKTGPTSFEDETIVLKDESITFEGE